VVSVEVKNKALVRRFLDEVYNRGDPENCARLISAYVKTLDGDTDFVR
jgi:hypothetical protein